MVEPKPAPAQSLGQRIVIWALGLALFCLLLIPPYYFGRAVFWNETPAEIISLFGYEVRFAYEVDGRRHEAVQDFQLVQGGLPPEYALGDIVTCLVSPWDPDRAILKRQSTAASVLYFLCSVIPPILVAGWVLRQWQLRARGRAAAA